MKRKYLTLILALVLDHPLVAQLERVELTEILESALTSRKSRISVRDKEVLTDNLKGTSAYEYLMDKYAGSGLIKLDSGRIVIDPRIEFTNSFLHRLELSQFKFNRRLSIINCTMLQAGNYEPWISFSNCRFQELRVKDNFLRDLFLTGSLFEGELALSGNSTSRVVLDDNQFLHKVLFHENRSTRGIEIMDCRFEATPGECLAQADSLTYDRSLENNIQFEFYSNFEDSDNGVNLSIEGCKFLAQSISQKAAIRSFNLSSLKLENNYFQSSLDLSGSAIQNQLIIRGNEFAQHVAFNDLIFPELFNIIYWEQFQEFKLAVYEPLPGAQACNEFGYEVPSSVLLYLGVKEQELTNRSGYEQLVNSYQSLFNIYKSRGDLESANGCYFELKDIVTRKLKYEYQATPSFDRYFKWQLNLFLKYFTDYGTRPAKAVEISLLAIVGFAVFYFFFPSDWDVLTKSNVLRRINLLIGYFKSEKSLLEASSTQLDQDYSSYKEFRDYLQQSKKEIPGAIYIFSRPLYQYSLFFQRFQQGVINRMDMFEGKWTDLSARKKFFSGIFIGLGFILFLLYVIIIKALNALTLSVNAFTTLGFGDIPTRGLARYVAIIQGFIGWFLLSIFSVALINQVLA